MSASRNQLQKVTHEKSFVLVVYGWLLGIELATFASQFPILIPDSRAQHQHSTSRGSEAALLHVDNNL